MIEVKGFRVISVPVPAPTGTRALIYGDSISAGAGASDYLHAYYSIYSDLTGLTVWSIAQFGRTVQENIQSFNATNSLENIIFNPTSDQQQYSPVLNYDPDFKYLIFRLGVNDILQKPNSLTDASTFKAKYMSCLNVFLSKGWPRNRIKLINIGSYLGANSEIQTALVNYNTVINELGVQYNFQVIDFNTLDAQNNRPSLYGDEVHPNNDGHLIQGTYLSQILP